MIQFLLLQIFHQNIDTMVSSAASRLVLVLEKLNSRNFFRYFIQVYFM